jgi:hypothetical protein
MSNVFNGRYTAVTNDPFVVFIIGMRINKFLALNAWLPVARAGQPEVHLTYVTAEVGEDGVVRLLEDPYGEDERLRRALQALRSGPPLMGAHQERGRPESRWTKS